MSRSGGATVSATGGPLRNFTPNQLAKFRRSIGRVISGTGDSKILCVGDSTSSGVGAFSGTVVGDVPSYPTQLVSRLNGVINASRGLGVPPTSYAGQSDNRWTAGAGWNKTANYGAASGATWGGAVSAAGSLVYQDPRVLADKFDIYYLSNTAGANLGTFSVTATGGSTANQSSIGPSATIAKITVSASAAATTNSVTINWVSGNGVYIVGIEPWLSTTAKIRVANAGVGGSTSGNWANDSFAGLGGTSLIKVYAPDLTIISLGINDANNNVLPSSYFTNIQNLVATAQLSGDVVVLPPFPSSSGATAGWPNTLINQAAYYSQLSTLTLPTVDVVARFSSGDNMNALGMMFDTQHGNALLYGDVAQAVAVSLLGV